MKTHLDRRTRRLPALDSAPCPCPASTTSERAATPSPSAPSTGRWTWASPTSTPPRSMGPFHKRGAGRPGPSRAAATRSCLATKFGIVSHSRVAAPGVLDSSPASIRVAVEGSAEAARHRPHRPVLPAPGRSEDPHRGQPSAPLAELVAGGKVRHIGPVRGRPPPQSAAPHAVHPVTALQTEYSPLDPRSGGRAAAAAARAEHRLRSLLAARPRFSSPGRSARPSSYPTTTGAKPTPRFTGENFKRNLRIVDEVKAVARPRRAPQPAQVALAWLLAQGEDIAPIPGTKRVARCRGKTPPPTASS